MQFIDLGAQYAGIQDEVEEAVIRVLRSGQYILGPEVTKLEERLAEYAGVNHCVACASGTDALVMALMAKGVGRGDAVFTTPFTFVATAEAIVTVGATPVFVDVDPTTYNMDPKALRRAIEALAGGSSNIHKLPQLEQGLSYADLRPRGIIAVDLFGLAADYGAINAIAAEHDLFVVEDAAQSFGASVGNRRAGGLAEIGCTSFFPAKPLGCYGDGGALFTDDTELDALFRSIRVHGQGSDKYENVRIGITGRLDAIQAAILNVKMGVFDEEIAQRQRVAETYNRLIGEAGLSLVTPYIPEGYVSAWAQYSVLARDSAERQRLQSSLAEAGIPTMIYYPKSLHLQTAFEGLGYERGDFPVSEELGERIFSLPMHPYLDDGKIAEIVTALAKAAQ
jgi:dTDP-4-amino-4,6-dideoxygalactose transaminase